MIVIEDRNTWVYFDVDGTLIEWINCTDERADQALELDMPTAQVQIPIKGNIEQLKQFHRDGCTVAVWSQGGSRWAEKVVKALGLEEFVHVCLTKPNIHVDDLHHRRWIGDWKYFGPSHLISGPMYVDYEGFVRSEWDEGKETK